MMDKDVRSRTFELSDWSQHQEPNVTLRRRQHRQNQSVPSAQSVTSAHNEHLDQFLSGIRAERERANSGGENANTGGKTSMPVGEPITRNVGGTTPALRPSLPSGPRFSSQTPFPVVTPNRPPLWQNPPPVIVENRRDRGLPHQSQNRQGHWDRPDVARNVNQGARNTPRTAEKLAPGPLQNQHLKLGVSGGGTPHLNMLREGQQFPKSHFPPDNSFGHSAPHRQHHEAHPSRPHLSGPDPPGSSPSVPQPRGRHPSGQPPPRSRPFGNHPLEPLPTEPHPTEPRPTEPRPDEPYQPALHQSGPHAFEPPHFPHAPSFHHQFQPCVENQPNPSFPGPHPTEPRPRGPWCPPMPPPHAPPQQQQQGGVAAGPFSRPHSTPPPLPSHQSFQRHRFPEPHPFLHPQVPEPEKSQREKDEEWLTDWLRKNKIGQSEKAREPEQTPITLREGRQLARDLLLALRQLKEQTDMLDRRISKDESSWQYECRRANRIKERVDMLKARLFSKEVVNQLENKMKKTRKKRARLKRQRFKKHKMQEAVEAGRNEMHLRIDAELAKRLHAEQEKKREAELQEEVDKTLYEVRKKKQEAAGALELLKGLRKLRQLRKDAAQAKGVFTPRDSDVSFDAKLKSLEELMSQQSVLYREEERVMQVMLEEEHEEYKEQEKKRQKKRLEEKAIKDMQTKMKLLFGKEDLVRPDDPMYPFQQFYTQAQNNIHALVDIRHQWDQFLVPGEDPGGSAVPVSWVLPSEPCSDGWAAVLDS